MFFTKLYNIILDIRNSPEQHYGIDLEIENYIHNNENLRFKYGFLIN